MNQPYLTGAHDSAWEINRQLEMVSNSREILTVWHHGELAPPIEIQEMIEILSKQ